MNSSEEFALPRKPWLFSQAVALVLAIGFVDYITSWQWTMSVFYAIPIVLVAWQGKRNSALIIASFCAVMWYLANLIGYPHPTHQAYVWSGMNRLVYFVFVAIGTAALRNQGREAQARIEALTRARALEREIVQAAEREQMRIGQDLHDGLCQSLVAIDCAVACLKTDLLEKSLPEAEDAAAIQQMLRRAVIEARSMARGIFPVQMAAQGLAAALEELVETTNRSRRIEAICDVRGEVCIPDPELAMHLYRIAQEALSNALRHARADTVTIHLSEGDGKLRLRIIDDGCGLPTEGLEDSKGMGLRTIKYRAQLIGADLEIGPNPEGGTVVNCSLPLERAAERPMPNLVARAA